MTDKGLTCWAAEASQYCIDDFGEVSFAYCRLSGQTHVLNFFSASLLRLVSDHAPCCDINFLQSKLCSHLSLTREDCPLSLIESTLQELNRAGLLWRQTGDMGALS